MDAAVFERDASFDRPTVNLVFEQASRSAFLDHNRRLLEGEGIGRNAFGNVTAEGDQVGSGFGQNRGVISKLPLELFDSDIMASGISSECCFDLETALQLSLRHHPLSDADTAVARSLGILPTPPESTIPTSPTIPTEPTTTMRAPQGSLFAHFLAPSPPPSTNPTYSFPSPFSSRPTPARDLRDYFSEGNHDLLPSDDEDDADGQSHLQSLSNRQAANSNMMSPLPTADEFTKMLATLVKLKTTTGASAKKGADRGAAAAGGDFKHLLQQQKYSVEAVTLYRRYLSIYAGTIGELLLQQCAAGDFSALPVEIQYDAKVHMEEQLRIVALVRAGVKALCEAGHPYGDILRNIVMTDHSLGVAVVQMVKHKTIRLSLSPFEAMYHLVPIGQCILCLCIQHFVPTQSQHATDLYKLAGRFSFIGLDGSLDFRHFREAQDLLATISANFVDFDSDRVLRKIICAAAKASHLRFHGSYRAGAEGSGNIELDWHTFVSELLVLSNAQQLKPFARGDLDATMSLLAAFSQSQGMMATLVAEAVRGGAADTANTDGDSPVGGNTADTGSMFPGAVFNVQSDETAFSSNDDVAMEDTVLISNDQGGEAVATNSQDTEDVVSNDQGGGEAVATNSQDTEDVVQDTDATVDAVKHDAIEDVEEAVENENDAADSPKVINIGAVRNLADTTAIELLNLPSDVPGTRESRFYRSVCSKVHSISDLVEHCDRNRERAINYLIHWIRAGRVRIEGFTFDNMSLQSASPVYAYGIAPSLAERMERGARARYELRKRHEAILGGRDSTMARVIEAESLEDGPSGPEIVGDDGAIEALLGACLGEEDDDGTGEVFSDDIVGACLDHDDAGDVFNSGFCFSVEVNVGTDEAPSWARANKTPIETKSLRAAINSSDWEGPEGWKEAALANLGQINKHEAIEECEHEDLAAAKMEYGDAKVEVKNMLTVLKQKFDALGNPTRKKVRFVVADRASESKLADTFSPALSSPSRRIFAQLCVQLSGAVSDQNDIAAAYYYGVPVPPSEPGGRVLFCPIPDDFSELGYRPRDALGRRRYFKIVGNMPGRQDAGSIWFRTHRDFLLEHGFKQSVVDRCIFYQHEEAGGVLIVGVYVDDTWRISTAPALLQSLNDAWSSRFELAADVAATEGDFCGGHMRKVDDCTMVLSCERMYESLTKSLESSPLPRGYSVDVPMVKDGPKLCRQPPSSENPLLGPTVQSRARSIIGLGGFIACNFRPDAYFAFVVLTQFVSHNFTRNVWNAVLRWAYYLINSAEYCLTYRRYKSFDWLMYTDSSAGGVGNFGGYCAGVRGSALFDWKCFTPRRLTDSSAAAELVMATAAVKSVIGFRMLFKELKLQPEGPTDFMVDAQAVISGTEMEKITREMKYMAARYEMIRASEADGAIRKVKIPTTLNCADMFSKPLVGDDFFRLRALVLGLDDSDVSSLDNLD